MAKVLPELGDPVERVPSGISEATREIKKRVINTLIVAHIHTQTVKKIKNTVLSNMKPNF